MDTFDIRKYITENKIKEQEGYERRYAITFKDGSTEEVGKHISVSPEDVMGSLKKSFERQGKPVSDIKHLGIKPVGIYEGDMGDAVEFYMDYYDENEMPQEIRDAIADALEDGKSLEFIKGQIKNGFEDMVLPEGITEQEDVLDPEEGDESESPYDYDKEKVEAIIPGMEKKLAKAIQSAYNPEDENQKVPTIDQKYILSMIRDFRSNKDDYYQTISVEGPDETLKYLADKISLDYLKKYVDKNNLTATYQLGDAYDNLDLIFDGLTDFQYPARRIKVYIQNK